LKEFSKQLKVTKLTVEKSALLIEDGDYANLIEILNQFGQFAIGKLTLITLRNRQVHELERYGVTNTEIRKVIDRNGQTKARFVQMVDELSIAFKRQIKG